MTLAGCASNRQVPAQTALETTKPVYFTGTGGEGISLAILPPNGRGLAENQGYLPALVQGEFVSNFTGYSAISILDRVRLDDQYTELLSGYYEEDAEAGMDLGHLVPTDYIMGGSITKTATGYALQIQITKTAVNDKMTEAAYSGNCTFVELDNLTGVRRASLDLLQKMGVELTEQARTELTGTAPANYVNAQTALAQGITAQKSGTIVEALSYYYQAESYDPALLEAASRASVMSANISGGNIGENVRNDIQARNAWSKILEDAKNLYKDKVPVFMLYDTVLEQGSVDYGQRTVELSFQYGLWPDYSVYRVLAEIEEGLEKRQKRGWNLRLEWPPIYSFETIFSLKNETGQTIGTVTDSLRSYFSGPKYGNSPMEREPTIKKITFKNVPADNIIGTLSIEVVSINSENPQTAVQRKHISGIRAEPISSYRRAHGSSDQDYVWSQKGTSGMEIRWLIRGPAIHRDYRGIKPTEILGFPIKGDYEGGHTAGGGHQIYNIRWW
jgi:hypothetical protein